MSDDFYKKQLEEFGIESQRITKGDINKKRQEEREEATRLTIQHLMNSPQGRQWLYSLLDDFMANGSVFVPGKPDLTTFLLGLQYAGKALQSRIMAAASDKYHLMIEEEHTRTQALANTIVEK